jgi:hypothetical protein
MLDLQVCSPVGVRFRFHGIPLATTSFTLFIGTVVYDNQKDEITIVMSNLQTHGIVDGGHTYKVITGNQAGVTEDRYVTLEIMTGVEDDFEAIAGARNTSVQVKEKSLAELEGKLDNIKAATDSTQVGTTWRYVAKNGGPDRRFNNNRQLPKMLYGELRLSSGSGLNGLFQCSVPEAAAELSLAIRSLASHSDSDKIAVSFASSAQRHVFVRVGVWLSLVMGAICALCSPAHLNWMTIAHDVKKDSVLCAREEVALPADVKDDWRCAYSAASREEVIRAAFWRRGWGWRTLVGGVKVHDGE